MEYDLVILGHIRGTDLRGEECLYCVHFRSSDGILDPHGANKTHDVIL